MANFYSDQIQLLQPVVGVGGIAGAPRFPRATEVRGGIEVWRFSYTVPASGGPQINDTIDLAYLNVQQRVYVMFFTFGAAGAGATFAVGRVDPNNSANNNATYFFAATSIAAAGNSGPLVTNVGLQVGSDNLGDLSTGNTPPMFGAAPIIVRGTFAGAAPAAATVISGYMFVTEGQAA